jgi:hypothetical protein
MENTACSIERSGGDLSGEDSVRPSTVNDRIALSRIISHRHFEGSESLPVPEFNGMDGARGHEADCYVFGNALRGWVYALLPSTVLWAILIGTIYSLVKR